MAWRKMESYITGTIRLFHFVPDSYCSPNDNECILLSVKTGTERQYHESFSMEFGGVEVVTAQEVPSLKP